MGIYGSSMCAHEFCCLNQKGGLSEELDFSGEKRKRFGWWRGEERGKGNEDPGGYGWYLLVRSGGFGLNVGLDGWLVILSSGPAERAEGL